MIIPSIKEIFLFIVLNLCTIIYFNILLLDTADFVTHVRFYEYLTLNTSKIAKLVSVFLLTCFVLNLLFFRLIISKEDQKRAFLSAFRVSMGVSLIGIGFSVLIILIRGF